VAATRERRSSRCSGGEVPPQRGTDRLGSSFGPVVGGLSPAEPSRAWTICIPGRGGRRAASLSSWWCAYPPAGAGSSLCCPSGPPRCHVALGTFHTSVAKSTAPGRWPGQRRPSTATYARVPTRRPESLKQLTHQAKCEPMLQRHPARPYHLHPRRARCLLEQSGLPHRGRPSTAIRRPEAANSATQFRAQHSEGKGASATSTAPSAGATIIQVRWGGAPNWRFRQPAHWRTPSPVSPIDPAETNRVMRIPFTALADPDNRIKLRLARASVCFRAGGRVGYTSEILAALLRWEPPGACLQPGRSRPGTAGAMSCSVARAGGNRCSPIIPCHSLTRSAFPQTATGL
jgi:hypothetical protein